MNKQFIWIHGFCTWEVLQDSTIAILVFQKGGDVDSIWVFDSTTDVTHSNHLSPPLKNRLSSPRAHISKALNSVIKIKYMLKVGLICIYTISCHGGKGIPG